MPHLKKLHERFKDQGLVLISVHSDKDIEKMKVAAKEWGFTWPIAQDKDGKTMEAFACDSFPDYCIIDRKGILRFADIANGEVEKAVEALLKEKP